MDSTTTFHEILENMLVTPTPDASVDTHPTQNSTSKIVSTPFIEWWHRVPQMPMKQDQNCSKGSVPLAYRSNFNTKTQWIPVNLPPTVTQAFLYFHQNGWKSLSDKSAKKDLRRAYRALAKSHHPDYRSQNDTAPFRELHNHYLVLVKFIDDQSSGT